VRWLHSCEPGAAPPSARSPPTLHSVARRLSTGSPWFGSCRIGLPYHRATTNREYTHDDLSWGSAFSLGPTVNSASDDFGVTYFAGDGLIPPQLFFSSSRGGGSDFDIYVTEINIDGSFTPPVAVPGLATGNMEFLPAIRHDGLEIFLSSNRPGSLGGHDIWTSTRETVFDVWSEPVNLGPGINSTIDELYPAISSDQTTLFFFRAILGTQTPTSIWISTRSKVHPD